MEFCPKKKRRKIKGEVTEVTVFYRRHIEDNVFLKEGDLNAKL